MWSDYALATRHFLTIEGRLKIAALSPEPQTVERLKEMLEVAGRDRDSLRSQIQEHETQSVADAANA